VSTGNAQHVVVSTGNTHVVSTTTAVESVLGASHDSPLPQEVNVTVTIANAKIAFFIINYFVLFFCLINSIHCSISQQPYSFF